MVNAGAIAIAEMIKGATPAARVRTMLDLFTRFSGRDLEIDEAVFLSEQATGHRNRAIAYMMLNSAMIRRDPEEILDIYFRQCAVRVTCRDLAVMSATLANDGVNPVTGKRAIAHDYVHDVLTVMNTCGMYNYAGHWSYEIGVPAKSGVSGSVVAVIPGQAGIAVFAPPLDENGNSVRGIAACKEIAADFGLHMFKTHPNARNAIRRELTGDVIRSKRARTSEERGALDRRAGDIRIMEVQDALYFGSAERLLRRAAQVAAQTRYLILDLRRVFSCDEAARGLLERLCDSLSASGCKLVFAHVTETGALAPLYERLVEKLGDADSLFADRDSALEWCESQLLTAAPTTDTSRYGLSKLDLFKTMTPEEVRLLEGLAQPRVFEAGARIIREGDEARLFFIITRGTASVRLTVDAENERTVRVASIGPGGAFGEMALLDGGKRSASVIADERVVCYGFSVEELRKLGEEHPSILIKIFANMTRDLSERLRRANNEIRVLEN
jgi:glutaminase